MAFFVNYTSANEAKSEYSQIIHGPCNMNNETNLIWATLGWYYPTFKDFESLNSMLQPDIYQMSTTTALYQLFFLYPKYIPSSHYFIKSQKNSFFLLNTCNKLWSRREHTDNKMERYQTFLISSLKFKIFAKNLKSLCKKCLSSRLFFGYNEQLIEGQAIFYMKARAKCNLLRLIQGISIEIVGRR